MKLKVFIVSLLGLVLSNCVTQGLMVELKNPLDLDRSEIITIHRGQLEETLDCDQSLYVLDMSSREVLGTQLLDLDENDNWESLLIQVDMAASESRNLVVFNKKKALEVTEPQVFGRLVPERKDDFTWENDRIAFRMYGPALEATGEISSGVDVWVKSVENMIIDKWYAEDDYHKDHGEGGDFYKVGPTLGCGGLGILRDDTLYTSNNFTDHRILANGPLRLVFELVYAGWGSNGDQVYETKRVQIDGGEHFFQITSSLDLTAYNTNDFDIVAGLASHPGVSEKPVTIDSSDDYLILYEAFKGDNGFLGTAILRQPLSAERAIKKYGDQYLMVLPLDTDGVTYHVGAGWSKSPWITDEVDWKQQVLEFETRLKHPIQIKINN